MNKSILPKFAIIDCLVTGHQHYGLIVQLGSGDRGFVDSADIADRSASSSDWPAVGSRIRGVLLGYTKDGRARISAKHRDLMLIESLDDPVDALQEWETIERFGVNDAEVFFRSPNACPLLRWALAHSPESVRNQRASELISMAPDDLKKEISQDY